MVEIAPFAVIGFASAVAIVSIFACGYLYASMRIDRKLDEQVTYAPRHARQDQTQNTALRSDIRVPVRVLGDTPTSRSITRELLVGSAA